MSATVGKGLQGTVTAPCSLISRVGHDGRTRILTRFLRLGEIAPARVLIQLKSGKVAS
jgi:hypothetical protein